VCKFFGREAISLFRQFIWVLNASARSAGGATGWRQGTYKFWSAQRHFLVTVPDEVPAFRVESFYLAGDEIVLGASDGLDPMERNRLLDSAPASTLRGVRLRGSRVPECGFKSARFRYSKAKWWSLR
jgi:hypothetical protein